MTQQRNKEIYKVLFCTKLFGKEFHCAASTGLVLFGVAAAAEIEFTIGITFRFLSILSTGHNLQSNASRGSIHSDIFLRSPRTTVVRVHCPSFWLLLSLAFKCMRKAHRNEIKKRENVRVHKEQITDIN